MSGTKATRKLDNPGFTGANNNPNNPGTTNPFATDAEIDILQQQINSIVGGSGNYVISGNVSWSGSGLIYDVTTHVYVIQGTQYISAATQVTLTSDPTNPQYWVVYGDDTGSVGTIAGTPAPVPVPPSVDGLTQIVLATILVPAGATVPVITEITIYDEDAGTPAEWVGTSDDTNVNFASTNDPFQGTVSIETNLPLGTNREIILTPASPYTIVNPSTLVFQIKAKVDMSATTGRLYIGFFNGGSLVGNSVYIGGTTVPIYGFDATDTSAYQIVSIPMAAFGVLPATVGALRFFKLSGSSTADFFLDDVHILEGGSVTPPPIVLYLNDLGDVTLDFNSLAGVQDDDGKYLYYDETTQQFVTSEEVNHGTVIINGKKSTAGTIAKGLPVYLIGEDNDVVTVELADANGAGTIPVIGFTAEPLNDTESKHIMTFGKLTGVNTTNAVTTLNPNGETWAINQALYISTTPGGLTNVRPTGASTDIQRVAKVLKVDATGGHLQIFNTFRTAGLPNIGTGNIWVGDANGNPIETPLPTGTVDGSGTLNYITKWTPDGDTLGDSQIQDNGTSIGIGVAPSVLYYINVATTRRVGQLIINANASSSTGAQGMTVLAQGANTSVFGNTGMHGGGKNASQYSAGVVGTGGGSTLNVITDLGVVGVHGEAQLPISGKDSAGVAAIAKISSANDNYGLYVDASNIGAGNAYIGLLKDGTEGVGKVLTSDASGRASWQTPSGGGGSVWTPPKIGIQDFFNQGRTAPAAAPGTSGVRYVFFGANTTGPGAVTDPTIEFTKYMGQDDGNDYDGSALSFRISYQLFNTTPTAGADNVRWSCQITFITEGSDMINQAFLASLPIDMNVLGKTPNTAYSEVLTPNLNTGAATGVRGIRVTLTRLNSDAADTYNSDVDFLGIEILN